MRLILLALGVSALTASPVVAAAPYGVAMPSVRELTRIAADYKMVAQDVSDAATASRSADPNSVEASCFGSVVFQLSPLFDAITMGERYAALSSMMKAQYDRDLVMSVAVGDIETQQKIVVITRQRLGEISGMCGAYGGVIDKVRSMREIVDRTDTALIHFQSLLAR